MKTMNSIEPASTLLSSVAIRPSATDIAGGNPDCAASSVGAGGTIGRRITQEGICVLTFDRPDSSANIFDRRTMLELDAQLDFVSGNLGLRGLVVASAKPTIFIAGADLNALAEAIAQSPEESPSRLGEMLELGQRVFTRLAALSLPKVAAIHGACAGGGYELCLACDWRIATDDRATKIGLPETRIGIIPAWGGSTRLPRLIGLPRALSVILEGRLHSAAEALKLGMIDEIVSANGLVEAACRRIESRGLALRTPRSSFRMVLTNSVGAAAVIRRFTRSRILRKTRGNFPAPLKALEVVTRGVFLPPDDSLDLERAAALELGRTEVCRNLLHVHFLQECAKKAVARAGSQSRSRVGKAAVIGAGVMGAGIANLLATKGVSVALKDIDPSQLDKGVSRIKQSLDTELARGHLTLREARDAINRIHPTVNGEALADAEIVIEAAVEKLELKRELVREIETRVGPRAVIATNTSALSVSRIADAAERPGRVAGLHFFNPVHRMPLVEVVRGEVTDEAALSRAVSFAVQIGKVPVVVADSPGFLVNRILTPYLAEAGRLFEEGVDAKTIDEAMLTFGMPMGPLRLIDEIGMDIAAHVANALEAGLGERFAASGILTRMRDAGFLGRKAGQGFYDYSSVRPRIHAGAEALRSRGKGRRLSSAEVSDRLVALMLNEAMRCLSEEIVEDAEDVDLAMILGAGFAPHTGGPLRYLDALGAARLVARLGSLFRTEGARFAPCDLLLETAELKQTIYPRKGESS